MGKGDKFLVFCIQNNTGNERYIFCKTKEEVEKIKKTASPDKLESRNL